MRKLMVLAAMVAMMLAMASPAFAQATAVDLGDDTDNSVNVSGSALTNVSQVSFQQTGVGDQNAAATDGDATNAANSAYVDVFQANFGFNGFFLH